jgi:hypothetical protein
VYLHERAKSPEPLEILSGLNRPSGHDIGMEAPLIFGEIDSFAGDDENDEMNGAVVPDSSATISTGSSIAVPQGGETLAIAEVEDYVNIPEIAIGAQKGPDFAGSESALEYAPVVYEEPEVNSNINPATPNTSLDLDEQQLIEPSISNDLLELPRAFDIADLPDGIFDGPSVSESGSFANNVLEDFTRPPAVVTSSPSPTNADNDFSRPNVSHKPDYSRPDLVSSSSIHPSGVVPVPYLNESFALPTTPSIFPANINNNFARPELVSQKRSRSTKEIWADALSEPEPAGDSPPADDAGVLQADAVKRQRMHLAILARSAGFVHEPGLRTLRLQDRIPIRRTRKGAVMLKLPHYLLMTSKVSNMLMQFIPREKVFVCNASILWTIRKSVSLSLLLLNR